MPDPSPIGLLSEQAKQAQGNLSKIISLWLVLAKDPDLTIRRLTLVMSFIAFCILATFLFLLIHLAAALVFEGAAEDFNPFYYFCGVMGFVVLGVIFSFPTVLRFGERAEVSQLEAGMINVEQRRHRKSDADAI